LSRWRRTRFPIYRPDAALVARFDNLVKPMDEELRVLYSTVQQLTATRDALLPRLISGKLKVDHLDVRMPPSMQGIASA
jgi:type I restriction enzyme S subunit